MILYRASVYISARRSRPHFSTPPEKKRNIKKIPLKSRADSQCTRDIRSKSEWGELMKIYKYFYDLLSARLRYHASNLFHSVFKQSLRRDWEREVEKSQTKFVICILSTKRRECFFSLRASNCSICSGTSKKFQALLGCLPAARSRSITLFSFPTTSCRFALCVWRLIGNRRQLFSRSMMSAHLFGHWRLKSNVQLAISVEFH